MPDKDDFDFESIFDEEKKKEAGEAEVASAGSQNFNFDDDFPDFEGQSKEPLAQQQQHSPVEKADTVPSKPEPAPAKKRSSEDFEPDMDALLITALSPMINEAMKHLTRQDFSVKSMPVFAEAIKGINLYIKILQRNPHNYFKLSEIIVNDVDCSEVERIAFNLFKAKFGNSPGTDGQKLTSFELYRERIKVGHNKATLSSAFVEMKKYFLLSGGLDEDKVKHAIVQDEENFKAVVARQIENLKIAVELQKTGQVEITKGLRGRDLNNYMIRSAKLLALYYHFKGNKAGEEYYRRLQDNYSKYFIIR